MSLSTFTRSVRIECPAEKVFAWHERPGAFTRLAPPWQKLEVISQIGGIRDGARVSLRTKIGPVWVRWDVEHRNYVEGVQFRDVQLRGPFAHWEHVHRVEPVDGGRACVLTDEIKYELPFGVLGRMGGGAFARRELERLFTYRHAVTKMDLENEARYISVRPMRFLIAGASGLVGRALTAFLQTQGHTVLRLVRRATRERDEVFWNPAKGEVDPQAMRGVDGVINLSGEGVADRRWSAERKAAILRSRIDSTRTVVSAIGAVQSERLRPFVFVSASAIGIYGNRGDEVLDESAVTGSGFLADVCTAWEREAVAADALGVRVVELRTGVVLTPAGGALAKLLPVFKAGLGGRLGNGKMWMSWISLDDLVGVIYHAVLDRRCAGPVNAVAPQAVTNADFTRVLGRVLCRTAVLPVPAVVLRTVFGEMADETLLSSARVVPAKLAEAGYGFRHESVEVALHHLLGQSGSKLT
ncbi:TIGR01777 family oxidoreductase [Rariglobus hedericola]|uniref:TIGR01777 family protein n=1 Tax=Rariglobus hedericola TaxID=2597822 RepID=A0A556QNS1_9BACT|nr:TIGR01777 family oxidoreductase [Rariglobus hedericola]TSJ78242.1 TIGR01777 family protein [Rariglobus hedericola]